jgi:enamine deaminase RidA (YjgF/YER057c/UK114 family)
VKQIDDYLARAGATKDDMVSVNIWLASMADAPGMNQVWEKWVNPGKVPRPRHSRVEARDAADSCRDHGAGGDPAYLSR